MTSMKDLEQRIEALEARLDEQDARSQAGAATLPSGEPTPDAGKGGDLELRLARLENLTGHRLPDHGDRIAADKRLVSRFANSREEAVAQQAARDRLEALGIHLDDRGQVPAEDDPEVGTPTDDEWSDAHGDASEVPAGSQDTGDGGR